jgi:pimeloyl-ACP methyl ester carboxylesterase
LNFFGFDIGRIFVLGLVIALGGYVGMGVLLYVFQSQLVYVPKHKMVASPADIGLSYQDVELESADGVRLSAWWVPSEKPRGVLLFCHGNGGNISHLLERIGTYRSLGLSTFVFDYRGYGKSAGKPTEEGTYLDVEAAWNYLVEEQGVAPEDILVYGWSLGGPIAAWLAQRHNPGKLVLESTFTALPELAQQLYPFFPARLLARFEYNTLDYLTRVRCPILVVHSREDGLIPFDHGQRLYEGFDGPRKFLEIEGDHGDGFSRSVERYKEALDRFISDSG